MNGATIETAAALAQPHDPRLLGRLRGPSLALGGHRSLAGCLVSCDLPIEARTPNRAANLFVECKVKRNEQKRLDARERPEARSNRRKMSRYLFSATQRPGIRSPSMRVVCSNHVELMNRLTGYKVPRACQLKIPQLARKRTEAFAT